VIAAVGLEPTTRGL